MSLEIPLSSWLAFQEEGEGEIWAPAGYKISCHLTLHLVKFWMERIPILPPSNKVLKKYNKKYHRTYLVEGGAMRKRYSQSSETIPKPHVVGRVWFPAVAVAFQ